MIHRAFESGVNHIGTAVCYRNQDSQRAVGEAIKGWRDNAMVSTGRTLPYVLGVALQNES